MNIVLIIPIFDDWESAVLLCDLIDSTFQEDRSHRVTIVFVDDGSLAPDKALRTKHAWSAIHDIHVLRLRRNVGHQRAIAIGLAYVEKSQPCDAVVVMDGDGEDLPRDIPALLARMKDKPTGQIVFAERGRRPEGRVFRVFYFVYRVVHRILTGRGIRFGNFSAIPFDLVRRLTVVSEIWAHYAAAVINGKIPYTAVRVDRGRRLTGTTKMNLESLILHGLMAVAVYQTVSVRVLMGSALLSGILFLLALGIVLTPNTASTASPGWTPIMLGICLIMICVITLSSVLYVFTSLSFRHLMGVLPARDYVHFIDGCERVYPTGTP
jgi:polyisoprenyl-phosphate glycosyltransferase